MKFSPRFALLAALGVMAAACAPQSNLNPAGRGPVVEEARHARGPIRRQELERGTSDDLLAAVRTLRPGWLRVGNPKVYVGAAPVGYSEALRDINPVSVEGVSYLSPNQAIARYGRDHAGGAIIVTMRS